jgi:hypothetical protein
MFQTILAVNLIRKAVVADRYNYADRYNPITYVIPCTDGVLRGVARAREHQNI